MSLALTLQDPLPPPNLLFTPQLPLCRLGVRHDIRTPPSVWVSLALTLQDPLVEVRHAFGAKLCRRVQALQQAASGAGGSRLPIGAPAWLATKYAAMLPLAGVPVGACVGI